jgi:hypothetical protein
VEPERWAARAETYEQVLTLLNRNAEIVRLTLGAIERGQERPAPAPEGVVDQVDARVATYATPAMRLLLAELSRTQEAFGAEVRKFLSMQADIRAGTPQATVDAFYRISPTEARRLILELQDRYVGLVQRVRNLVAEEMADPIPPLHKRRSPAWLPGWIRDISAQFVATILGTAVLALAGSYIFYNSGPQAQTPSGSASPAAAVSPTSTGASPIPATNPSSNVASPGSSVTTASRPAACAGRPASSSTPSASREPSSIAWRHNPTLIPHPGDYPGGLTYAPQLISAGEWNCAFHLHAVANEMLVVSGATGYIRDIGPIGDPNNCFVLVTRGPFDADIDAQSAGMSIHRVTNVATSLEWASRDAAGVAASSPATCGAGVDVWVGQ